MKYNLKFVKVQEIWYEEEEQIDKDVDLVFYHQLAKAQKQTEKFYTLLLNLEEEEQAIYDLFVKNNKYEINRATTKDSLSFEMYHENITQDVLVAFNKAYNQFADERNRTGIKGSDFENYRNNGKLAISTIADETGVLVWHTYIVIGNRVRLKTSNSIFANQTNETRNLVGRANRLLHWKDMQYFKNKGYTLYDFGGWYAGDENSKLLGINKFKESFGGYKEQSYNYTKAVTSKGKLFLSLNRLKAAFSK